MGGDGPTGACTGPEGLVAQRVGADSEPEDMGLQSSSMDILAVDLDKLLSLSFMEKKKKERNPCARKYKTSEEHAVSTN